MNQVLCLHLLLLGLPAALPLPQFLLRPNSIFSPATSFSPAPAPVGGAPSSGGGEDGAGLLFPLPGGGNLEDAEDLEDSVDPEDNAEDISQAGNLGPSDPNIIQGGSSCQVLVSDFELCKWGPSCATILREQFSHCDYDCATCTLH